VIAAWDVTVSSGAGATTTMPSTTSAVVSSPAAEDAVSTGSDETGNDQQNDSENDLSLKQLHYADDGDDGRDEPQNHGVSLR
jgi:hypothetical protein